MANNAPMTHEDHWSRPVTMTPDGQWLSLREVVEEEPTQVPFNRLFLKNSQNWSQNAFGKVPNLT